MIAAVGANAGVVVIILLVVLVVAVASVLLGSWITYARDRRRRPPE